MEKNWFSCQDNFLKYRFVIQIHHVIILENYLPYKIDMSNPPKDGMVRDMRSKHGVFTQMGRQG